MIKIRHHRKNFHSAGNKPHSKKKNVRKVIVIILCLIVLYSAVRHGNNLLLFREISVDGYNGNKTVELSKLLKEYNNSNFFLLNEKKLMAQLKKVDPSINKIIIKKIFPNKLSLFTEIKKTFAKVIVNPSLINDIQNKINSLQLASPEASLSNTITEFKEDKIYWISKDGEPIEPIEDNGNYHTIILPQYEGNGRINNEIIEDITYLKDNLKDYSSFLNETIIIDRTLYIIRFNNDLYVIFSGNENISGQVRSLQVMLDRFTIEGIKPKKIDLRFAKPVVLF